MTDDSTRHSILDLATEDYIPLPEALNTLQTRDASQTIKRVIREMLHDGALAMFRGDRFIGEETAIAEAVEIDAALDDPANWEYRDAPRLAIVSTDRGDREYYRDGPQHDDSGEGT